MFLDTDNTMFTPFLGLFGWLFAWEVVQSSLQLFRTTTQDGLSHAKPPSKMAMGNP
jgi:hypothetical protein